MKRTRIAYVAVFVASSGFFACDAIVGVTDVRLVTDAGAADVIAEGAADQFVPDTGPPGPPNLLEVALGETHTCAREPAGTVKCWGDDSKGQTGTGGDGGIVPQPTATNVTDAVHVSSGKGHSCVLHKGGAVSCWGDDVFGQLGDGQTNTRSPVPVAVNGLNDAIAIGTGASASCAVKSDGSAVCWGDNLSGELGTGGKASSATPVPVVNLTNLASISCGDVHGCAVSRDGKVSCWGTGSNGQLGNNGVAESDSPVSVALDGVIAVAAASRSTCALKSTGEVYCWGANDLGQTGGGTANAIPVVSPVQVQNVDAVALWAGADHVCVVRRSGIVACWGAGSRGQLGDGEPRPDASTPEVAPVNVDGITNAIGIGTGGMHSCAPTKNGAILCWGANDHEQLGNGGVSDLLTPESVVGYP